MKLRPIAIAALTLSSAATFALAAPSDKSPSASNPGYFSESQSARENNLSSQNDNATISQLQQALNAKGYDAGPVDGQLGARTKTALRQFQQSQGLPASGQIDPQTLAALSPEATTSPKATQGTSGSGFSPQPPSSQQQQSPGSSPS